MRRTITVAILAAVVGALVATPIAVYASHSFTDVPDSNTFHADIEWLADAGVTKGCNPPTNSKYCPKDNVTREQMAAFMRRLAMNRVVDADKVDGRDASAFLAADGKASDSDKVDGRHASAFVLRSEIPADGATSCAGAGFYPTDQTVDYQGTAPRTGSDSSASAFVCALDIPNSATVTRFTASAFRWWAARKVDADITYLTKPSPPI